MSMINKINSSLKNYGLRTTIKRITNKIKIKSKIDLNKKYDFILNTFEISLKNYNTEAFNKKELIINWLIPEPSIGSGGHTSIFRFIIGLEKLGICNRIYVINPIIFKDDKSVKYFIVKNYHSELNKIEIHSGIYNILFAHAIIATSWETAYYVRRFINIKKFYFVQDYEPYFFSMGSEYFFAENTYKFGFKGITAGEWLKKKLLYEHGMISESFGFSYDREIYKPEVKKDNKNRLFFYARPITERRAFEMGFLALTELYKRISDIEVIFAGGDISKYKIPFNHVNTGSIKPKELAYIYAQCDMCIVLSYTNLSLLPLEIMASNSVVVCNKGEHADWLTNDNNSILVENDPILIADKLEYYLKNKNELEKYRKDGIDFSAKTSWDNEFIKIKDFILRETNIN